MIIKERRTMNDKNVRKVRMRFEGQDGNAFNLLGHFMAAARDQGWEWDAIEAVLAEVRRGDHDHLLQTLLANTEDPGNYDNQ